MRVLAWVLVSALLATACSGDPRDVGRSESTSSVPVPDGLADGCPERDAPIRYAAGDLPPGATSVRLCPGPPIVAYDGTIRDVGIQPPELVTTRVVDLVDAVNTLESAPPVLECEFDAGPRLTYWFGYPDGDARAVTFENFGCEVLLVGPDVRRVQGEQVARAFVAALLEQRAASSPPGTAYPPLGCHGVLSAPNTALPSLPIDLDRAVVCVEAGPYRVREAEVPGVLLAELERGLVADSTDWSRCVALGRRHTTVLGRTAWGDVVRYPVDACGRVTVANAPGWLRERAATHRVPPGLAARLDALSRGPVIRFDDPTTTASPPATPG